MKQYQRVIIILALLTFCFLLNKVENYNYEKLVKYSQLSLIRTHVNPDTHLSDSFLCFSGNLSTFTCIFNSLNRTSPD